MLIDCGLMFPDADMLGVDLVLPDFTWLLERGDRHRGLHRHPRPRGPPRRPVVPPARAVVPDHRLGADARPGPQPHRGGRPARPHRADRGQGQRAAEVRPVRLRVHPRHPLGAPRLRHRVPHAAGHHPPHRRLQARPHPGRRAPHRPRPPWAPSPRTRASACCCPTPPTPTSTATPARETSVGKVLVRPVPRQRGPADRHRLLRQPHPPHPADRRRRHRLRPGGRHPRAVDEEERAAGPRDGPAEDPRLAPARHRRRRRPRARARCASSPPGRRASPCRRCR